MKFIAFITTIIAVVSIAGCSLAKSTASKPTNAAQPNNSQVTQAGQPTTSAPQSVQAEVVTPTQDEVHTPEMGSSERQAIMRPS